MFLDAIFKSAHYEVATAATGAEGIDKALRLVPDLVITDGIMPDVDGFEVIGRMKENPPTANIPVVMLTSGAVGSATVVATVKVTGALRPVLPAVSDWLARTV